MVEHENGTEPLRRYLNEAPGRREFIAYDDEILYESGRIDTEGKRQVDGEWVEGYDEYDGFAEFDEDGLRHLGGYTDEDRSDGWIGPNREPEVRRDAWEEDGY